MWLLYIVVPILLLGSAGGLIARRWKKTRKNNYGTEEKPVSKKLETEFKDLEKETASKKSEETSPALRKRTNLTIVFPLLDSGIPDVWGIEESFQVKVVCRDEEDKPVTTGKIKIYINESLLSNISIKNGESYFNHLFAEKGEYDFRCEFLGNKYCQPSSLSRKIRIVDFREEIVSMYNSLLEHLRAKGIQVRINMTPREAEQAAVKEQINRESMSDITECFELAQYSTHPIKSKYYVTMFKATERIMGEQE